MKDRNNKAHGGNNESEFQTRKTDLIARSLSKLTPEQVSSIAEQTAIDVLQLELKLREQEQNFFYGRKAAEDHIETFAMLEKQGNMVRQTVISDIKTGAGNMKIESKSGKTCFVATATYQDAYHPDVVFLRHFRDTVLTKYKSGRYFIKIYWIVGPKLAILVDEFQSIRTISRAILSRMVKIINSRKSKKQNY